MRASGRSPPLGGGYSASGNERAMPLAFPPSKQTETVSLPKPQRGTKSAPLHGVKPAGWCARAIVRQRPSGHERGKSASGSGRKRRPLRSAQRGTERVRQNSRSTSHAPDRHPHGPGPRPGPRQRIEQVARRAANSDLKDFLNRPQSMNQTRRFWRLKRSD